MSLFSGAFCSWSRRTSSYPTQDSPPECGLADATCSFDTASFAACRVFKRWSLCESSPVSCSCAPPSAENWSLFLDRFPLSSLNKNALVRKYGILTFGRSIFELTQSASFLLSLWKVEEFTVLTVSYAFGLDSSEPWQRSCADLRHCFVGNNCVLRVKKTVSVLTFFVSLGLLVTWLFFYAFFLLLIIRITRHIPLLSFARWHYWPFRIDQSNVILLLKLYHLFNRSFAESSTLDPIKA
jgi:hypothetical protein